VGGSLSRVAKARRAAGRRAYPAARSSRFSIARRAAVLLLSRERTSCTAGAAAGSSILESASPLPPAEYPRSRHRRLL